MSLKINITRSININQMINDLQEPEFLNFLFGEVGNLREWTDTVHSNDGDCLYWQLNIAMLVRFMGNLDIEEMSQHRDKLNSFLSTARAYDLDYVIKSN